VRVVPRPYEACICGKLGCTRHGRGSSNWGKYLRDHPERANFYRSSSWRRARAKHLASHPNCALCGAKATICDHIWNRAAGGPALDPSNLQSMCGPCHQRKTVAESHRGMKLRAAQRRPRGYPR
jgi:5-methylcytosine-specific restriction enzyme A